jgi:predicted Zn-dependent protease
MQADGEITGIDLVTLAAFPQDLASRLLQRLSRRVRVPCRLLPPDDAAEQLPRLDGRDQVDADRLLERLEQRPLDPGTVLIGATLADVGNPIFTFFFGRARHFGQAALISLARLDPTFYGLPPDEDSMLQRAVLEVLHELGHLAGLHHCEDYACLMRFAPTVEAIDVRGAGFCEECAGRLPDELLRHGT